MVPDPSPPPDGVDLTGVPAHVACVMDGNGRWASQRGPAPDRGPRRRRGGAARRGRGRPRDRDQLAHHVRLLDRELAPARRRGPLPDGLQRVASSCAGATSCTRRASGSASPAAATGGCRAGCSGGWTSRSSSPRRNRRMTLTMAFNYGGRAEIVDAVRALVAEGTPAGKDRREGHPARISTSPTSPTPTWSSARRASTGSRTSCCGSWPTRAGLHRRAVARLPPAPPLRGRRRVPAARASLRRGDGG